MKYLIALLLCLVSFAISATHRRHGYYNHWRHPYPWTVGYHGYNYNPYYNGIYTRFPYVYYFSNPRDGLADDKAMLFEITDDICSNDLANTEAMVCGFNKDKMIVRAFNSACEASKDDNVNYIACGKCPDAAAPDQKFDLPLTKEMPVCKVDN